VSKILCRFNQSYGIDRGFVRAGRELLHQNFWDIYYGSTGLAKVCTSQTVGLGESFPTSFAWGDDDAAKE
jgi:hypothetical protein